MSGVRLQWLVAEPFHQMLLRDYLRQEKEISRQSLSGIKRSGQLLINGRHVTVRAIIMHGDVVTVVFPPETRSESLVPKELPLSIIYEDEHFVVINKQANMPTIPSIYHPEHSLANGVMFYYIKNKLPYTFHAVNRLDRDTTGLLLIAKHSYAHDLMTKEQKEGRLKRTYVALVHGHVHPSTGIITAPIARKAASIIEREVHPDGQPAVTKYEVVEHVKNATLVRLNLETGRTHQIRVHMAYKGHPLLGDDLYGGKLTEIKRQALHSFELQFFHPFLQQELRFTVELAADIAGVINKLKENV